MKMHLADKPINAIESEEQAKQFNERGLEERTKRISKWNELVNNEMEEGEEGH